MAVDYTNISDIKKFWLEEIAPKYFDMQNTNNYQVGVFGYINEIIGNTAEDAFNAINVARREFYPVTALYKSTLYKMAATQRIGLPMTTPASSRAILLLQEKEIINNATYNNGLYTFVIDNTLEIMADNIPFLLDYPIIIISKKEGDKWIHTSHYDINIENSLSNNTNKYILNKTINQGGVNYILLSVSLRQLSLQTMSELVVKDNIVDTVTMDFRFEGNLANFEVFYKNSVESDNEIQLKKILKGSSTPQVPFCSYELLDSNSIRLIFYKNPYFTPAFNSEVIMRVYTSFGEEGEFDVFKGDLVCRGNSEKYPYNNTMFITGQINGECKGGVNKVLDDEFRNMIIDVYATNNTFTSSNDLQIYFDKIARANKERQNSKILFRKKRDDALIRLFGAYILLKDTMNNVVPTNTLDITVQKKQILTNPDESQVVNRLFIKPGTIFDYKADTTEISYGAIKSNLTIKDNMNPFDDNSRFLFTNPFLIALTLDPNIVGYYLNSIETIKAVEYRYVNDNTLNQFIGSNLRISRNALMGENYYKVSMQVAPASDIDPALIMVKNPPEEVGNTIRAKLNGVVKSLAYADGAVYLTVEYEDATTEKIQISSTVNKVNETFVYTSGFSSKLKPGLRFVKNDIIATKKVTDLGRLRMALDFKGILYDNGMYIPFVIEEFDTETQGYNVAAYIATDDVITLEAQLLVTDGICMMNGVSAEHVAIPMNKLEAEIHVFFDNVDANFTHKYDNFAYFDNYTLSNTYSLDTSDNDYKIALVQQIDFIRSTMNFIGNPDDPDDYGIIIKEVPVVKANWSKSYSNFRYFVSNILGYYKKLYEAYFLLENNFGIDLKFFNTYGKSRFFKVGIKNNNQILNSVNCSFNFGVYLTSLTQPDAFLIRFREYVKNYVESVNLIVSEGQSLYIMNLITQLKNEFSEIGYIEYYGMNNYSHEAQKIEGLSDKAIIESGIIDYIPEFINVRSESDGITMVPKIEVTLLDS